MPKHDTQPMPVMSTRSRMKMRTLTCRFKGVQHMVRVLVALSLLIAFPSAGSGQKQNDLFTELFNRSLAAKQSMKSIRARFTETTTSTLLEKPLVAHGTIVAAPPARVRMTYTEPERRT